MQSKLQMGMILRHSRTFMTRRKKSSDADPLHYIFLTA